MMPNRPKIFLDTSVIIAAVISSTGGARRLMKMGELGSVVLFVGPNVLRECEEVVRRKLPKSLPKLAYFLEAARVQVSPLPDDTQIQQVEELIDYHPDVLVLAEAIMAQPDWLVTHDKAHLLKLKGDTRLPFMVGTPGDFLQAYVGKLN